MTRQGVKKVDVVREKFVSGIKIGVTYKIIKKKYYEKMITYYYNNIIRLYHKRNIL